MTGTTTAQTAFRTSTPDQVEEWFLQRLGEDPLPSAHMIAMLKPACEHHGPALAGGIAEMLKDALAERKDAPALLALFRTWAQFTPEPAAMRETCHAALAAAAPNRTFAAFIAHAGFKDSLPLAECLRRLDTLLTIKPGGHVRERTWGFGVVARVDDFYAKITVDFTGKRGHQMSFAYAAEALQVLADDHWFVRLHVDRAGLVALARERPGDLVRLLIRSLGPLSVPDIKAQVTESLLAEADWQGFWDAARAALKCDPTVEIPTRRSAPVRILEKARAYDDNWFDALGRERSPAAILAAALTLEKNRDQADTSPRNIDILAGRIAFGIRGSEDADPDLAARLFMAATRLSIALPDAVVEAFLGSESRLVTCLQRLPTREGAAFLECAAHRSGGRLQRALAADLERLPVKAIGEVLPFLVREGAAEDCLARIRTALLSQQGSSPTLVCWMVANPEAMREYRLGDLTAVFLLALGVLDRSEMGDQMRAQKQLREHFLDTDWLQSVFEATDESRRLDLVRRLDGCTGWDATAKRSVLARVIKLYPDLTRALSVARPAEASADKARFTSWRSLRARQEQLRKIKEEDIPANSREIGVARSYGDLRENFEYQSARDLQRMLLKREAELQGDLAKMQGTDFSDASCDRIGMGVEVELVRPNGSHRVIRILGEWDRDEERAVVSSHSLVAERLGGLAVGDTAVLPMDGSEETCRIEAVRPLPDDVRQWAATGP